MKNKYVLLICGVYVLLAVFLLNPQLPHSDDGDDFLLLSQSIADGQGYKDLYCPSQPPHTTFPFLYPLFLALIRIFFSGNIFVLKSFSVVLGCASLIFIFFLFEKKLKNSQLMLLLFLVATNPGFLSFSTGLNSDMPYLFFSVLLLFVLQKYKDKEEGLLLIIFLAVVTFFIRWIGLSLILTVFIYFFVNKQYKKAFVLIGSCFLFILPWIIRNHILSVHSTASKPYLWQFIAGYQGNIFFMVKTVLNNAAHYYEEFAKVIIPGFFLYQGNSRFFLPQFYGILNSLVNCSGIFIFSFPPLISKFVQMFFAIMVLVGFFKQFKKNPKGIIHLYVIIYMVVIVILPKDFQQGCSTRYVFSLLPFITYYAIKGFYLLLGHILFFKRAGIFLIVSVSVFFNVIPVVEILQNNVAYLLNHKHLSLKEKKDYYNPWLIQYFSTALWLKENTSFDELIISNIVPAFYIYSQKKGFFFDKNIFCPRQKTLKQMKAIFEKKNTDYLIIYDVEEKINLLRRLDRECKGMVFVPLVVMFEQGQHPATIYKLECVEPKIKSFFTKAISAMIKDNYDEAIMIWEKAILIDPEIFFIYYYLGQCYEKKGLIKKAQKLYEKAVEQQPNYEISNNRLKIIEQEEITRNATYKGYEYQKLGELYLNNYNSSKAIDSFKTALNLNPGLVDCYYHLGRAYVYKEKYGLAMLYFKKAKRINPRLKDKIKHQIKINKRRRIICQEGEEDD